MKTVVVTGFAGFIGHQLTKFLLSQGITVIGLDDLSTGKQENFNYKHPCLHTRLGDLNSSPWSLERYLKMFGKIDCVFHLAALPRVQPSIEDPMPYHEANVQATVQILDIARRLGIKRFVFSSSSSIYGDPDQVPTTEDAPFEPMSPYALHKQVGEHYCKLYAELYGMQCTALRYFNVYGEGQPTEGAYVPVVGIWMKQKALGQSLTITGDGTQTRDFVCVDDVVRANFIAATVIGPPFAYFNIGSGTNMELNKIAALISDDVTYVEKRHEPHTTMADISKAKWVLGWEPKVDLKDWVERNK